MSAYYNEIDPFKAAELRELIRANLIAPGEVDERSIEDVEAKDLKGFTQCHFFAGVGVWSYALRLAGWPDDRPVWTGSCPCPSFSAAGKGEGFEDPRHLWPRWFGLIRESRPPAIFGEQADKAIGFGWLDLVQTDLEAEGYAVGATVFGAHSVGAPHRRQRLYFVADSADSRYNDAGKHGSGRSLFPARLKQCSEIVVSSEPTSRGRGARRTSETVSGKESCGEIERPSLPGSSSDSERNGGRSNFAGREKERRAVDGRDCEASDRPNSNGRNASTEGLQRSGKHGLRAEDGCSGGIERDSERAKTDDGGHPAQRGLGMHRSAPGSGGHTTQSDETGIGFDSFQSRLEGHFGDVREWRGPGWLDPITARSVAEAGATRGFWADCDWWYGRDGKYRPIGAGLFPLVNGAPARVGRLRGYGDAIVAQVAKEFIEAYMSVKVSK